MSALWSRVARQSSCNCRLCHHPSVRVARRTTTAASRRKISGADLFTACYTTIFGTAALLDARNKGSKRQALDRKIDEAKSALNGNATAGTSRGTDIPNPADRENHPQSKCVSRRRPKPFTDFSLIEYLAPGGCALPPHPDVLVDWVGLNASLKTEELQGLRFREAITETHLEYFTRGVMCMLDALLARSRLQPDGQAGKQAPPATQPEHDAVKLLESMLAPNPHPAYQPADAQPNETLRVRWLLNNSIRSVFDTATTAREAVAKISYNLLASSAPPSSYTYGALVAGFHRIQRADLAQIVVDSFVNDTKTSATPHMVALLLSHYQACNDREGFRDIIERMKGNRGYGFGLNAPAQSVWPLWSEKRRKVLVNMRLRSGRVDERLIEKTLLDPVVSNALARGWLHFGNLAAASRAFISSLRAGSLHGDVDVSTMEHLFALCVARVDHANARKIVKGMVEKLPDLIAFLNVYLKRTTKAGARNLIFILYQVLELARFRPDQLSQWCLGLDRLTRQLTRAVQTTLLAMDAQDSSHLCERVTRLLHAPDRSFEQKIGFAIKKADDFLGMWEETNAFVTVARVVGIDKSVQAATRMTSELTRQAEAAIVKFVLEIDQGIDLDPTAERTRDGARDGLNWQHMYASLYTPLLQNYFDPRGRGAGDLARQIRREIIRQIPHRHLSLSKYLWHTPLAQHASMKLLSTFWWSTARGDGASAQIEADELDDPASAEQVVVDRPESWRESPVHDQAEYYKALMFAELGCLGAKGRGLQSHARHLWPNWDDMPLSTLVSWVRDRPTDDSRSQRPIRETPLRAFKSCRRRRNTVPHDGLWAIGTLETASRPRYTTPTRMTAWQVDEMIKRRKGWGPEIPKTTMRSRLRELRRSREEAKALARRSRERDPAQGGAFRLRKLRHNAGRLMRGIARTRNWGLTQNVSMADPSPMGVARVLSDVNYKRVLQRESGLATTPPKQRSQRKAGWGKGQLVAPRSPSGGHSLPQLPLVHAEHLGPAPGAAVGVGASG